MKKNIFLILFALVSFAFSANAQSCCSKAKDKTSCSKKTAAEKSSCTMKKATTAKVATEEAATSENVQAILVSTKQVAGEKTVEFTVYGNCGMCEKTIENSLVDVKGVSKGDWDKKTDVMIVTFNPEVITLDDIKQKIADVGYDSDSHRAKEEVYNNLPGCCQYERPTK